MQEGYQNTGSMLTPLSEIQRLKSNDVLSPVMVIDDLPVLLIAFCILVATILIAFAVMDFLIKRDEREIERAKERSREVEREMFSQRLRERANLVASHVQTVVDYDFVRDATAGRETTEYKEGDDSDQVNGGGT